MDMWAYGVISHSTQAGRGRMKGRIKDKRKEHRACREKDEGHAGGK